MARLRSKPAKKPENPMSLDSLAEMLKKLVVWQAQLDRLAIECDDAAWSSHAITKAIAAINKIMLDVARRI